MESKPLERWFSTALVIPLLKPDHSGTIVLSSNVQGTCFSKLHQEFQGSIGQKTIKIKYMKRVNYIHSFVTFSSLLAVKKESLDFQNV